MLFINTLVHFTGCRCSSSDEGRFCKKESVMHWTVSKEYATQSRDSTNNSCWFHFHSQVFYPKTIPYFSSWNSQFFNITLFWVHSCVTKNKHRKQGEEETCVSLWPSRFEFHHVVARAITPSSQCWEGNLSWLVLPGFPHVPNYVFLWGTLCLQRSWAKPSSTS